MLIDQNPTVLSYFLSNETPCYGGRESIKIESTRCIAEGDACNQLNLEFSNHVGTHIDLPFHFDGKGRNLSQYQANEFIFKETLVWHAPSHKDEILTPEKFAGMPTSETAELLLINTEFYKLRVQKEYWNNNPAFHPDMANFLREQFPALRAIGFDTISLTGFQHRPMGKEAHQAFLSAEHSDRPIMIIEDMNFDQLKSHSYSIVIASPLMIEKGDGAQVTVWAFN